HAANTEYNPKHEIINTYDCHERFLAFFRSYIFTAPVTNPPVTRACQCARTAARKSTISWDQFDMRGILSSDTAARRCRYQIDNVVACGSKLTHYPSDSSRC